MAIAIFRFLLILVCCLVRLVCHVCSPLFLFRASRVRFSRALIVFPTGGLSGRGPGVSIWFTVRFETSTPSSSWKAGVWQDGALRSALFCNSFASLDRVCRAIAFVVLARHCLWCLNFVTDLVLLVCVCWQTGHEGCVGQAQPRRLDRLRKRRRGAFSMAATLNSIRSCLLIVALVVHAASRFIASVRFSLRAPMT